MPQPSSQSGNRRVIAEGIGTGGAGVQLAQVPGWPRSPGPEHRRLEVFLGTWETEGVISLDATSDTRSVITSSSTYEWLPGGFFLVHRFHARISGSGRIEGLQIIEHDAARRTF